MLDFDEVQRRGMQRAARCEDPDCPTCSRTTRPLHVKVVEPISMALYEAATSGDKVTLITAHEAGSMAYLIAGLAGRLDDTEKMLEDAVQAMKAGTEAYDSFSAKLRRLKVVTRLTDIAITVVGVWAVFELIKLI